MGITAPQQIILAYAVSGLFIGCLLSTLIHGHRLARSYKHADGSVNDSPVRTVLRTFPGFTATYSESISDGRPLTTHEMLSLGADNTIVFTLVSTFVGLLWGLVHMYFRSTREVLPPTDQSVLDYGESVSQNLPPSST